jgi:two-component system, sensor histidine kinase and response regulator
MKEFRFFAVTGILVCLWLPFYAQTSSPSDYKGELSRLTQSAFSQFLNSPDSAIKLSQKALSISIQQHDRYFEGYCYFVLSKTYWVKANYRLSTEYGFKALKIFEDSDHQREHASTLISLARTLIELGNFSTARDFLERAIKIGQETDHSQTVAEGYRELSYWFIEKGVLDSALYYSDKGITLFEKLRDVLDASILYSRKARIYFQLKEYEKSKEFALKGLRLDTLVGNYRGLAVSHYQVAQNDYALKNIAAAERHLKRSIEISVRIGNLTWLVRAHELLATLYMKTRRPQLAAEALQLAGQFKDSLYNSEKSGQIEEMRSLYELEGKESKIKLLEKENDLKQQEVRNQQLFVAFLLVGLLLLLALLFFLGRLRILQRKTNQTLSAKNAAIEQQREQMQSQAEKMQQLNHLQNKLFSVISHDLRGPISNLHSLLELLSRQLLSADEFLKISEKLKSNLNITQRTLENLLNWALSQMDGIKMQKRILDIGQCIEEAWRLMEESAAQKKITLTKTWKQIHLVNADGDQVQLVLRNLIHNAIKFSKIGDTIEISITEDYSFCTICIQDTGIGMSQQEIDLIVGSKAHFTKVGTLQEKGTGLGLLLCKEFTERNEGRLNIKSEVGKGTRVCFSLPVA